MAHRAIVWLLLIVSVVGLSACTSTRFGDFTLASTKNLGHSYTPLRRGVRGEDCTEVFLFIPVGSLNPTVEEALDRAVEQVPGGDMLINASIHNDQLITLLYNRNCIRVEGDVVSTKNSR